MNSETNIWASIEFVAGEVGLTGSNIIKMQQRGSVPTKHHGTLADKAEALGIKLTRKMLEQLKHDPVSDASTSGRG